MDDLKYKIGIGLIPGVGDILAKKLISYCGGVEAVFREKKATLLKIPNVGEALADAVTNQNVLGLAEKEIEFISRHRITCSFYLDDDYPRRLKTCPDSPVIFFYKGTVDLNCPKIVSIVGTRKATSYGKSLCNKLVDELSQSGHCPVIVSGLAYGIDICAHRAALRNGLPTIAVLGHGLSQIYPSEHASVAREITGHGALLTEYTSGSCIDRSQFIRRNRLIAGLADLTVIVESDTRGGALITAEIANLYNRDVFAFPGRITDVYSSGCNWLISTHRANLLQSVQDIEYLMNWNKKSETPNVVQQTLFPELPAEEEIILRHLKANGKCILDNICYTVNMPVGKVSTLLLNLELSGLVYSLPGKVYRAV
jgi:DNA processing protein